MTMRITTDQVLAGYPAIKVRDFLWKHQLVLITEGNFQTSFNLSPINARSFLKKLVELELLRERYKHNGYSFFEMTDLGHSLAHASAAKPIHRKTAERVLSQFIERVHKVNATAEYLYRIDGVILFGSMLSNAMRLGDVDVAVKLEPKIHDKAAFEEWGAARRHAARLQGRSFTTIVDEAYWPIEEVYKQLKNRSHSLSLHELSHMNDLSKVSYRVLLGDPERIATLIPAARCVA